MIEKHHNKLTQLIVLFPQFEDQLEHIYWKSAVFREVVDEYLECIDKQESILKETGKESVLYADTINELKAELFSYLDTIDSNVRDKV